MGKWGIISLIGYLGALDTSNPFVNYFKLFILLCFKVVWNYQNGKYSSPSVVCVSDSMPPTSDGGGQRKYTMVNATHSLPCTARKGSL